MTRTDLSDTACLRILAWLHGPLHDTRDASQPRLETAAARRKANQNALTALRRITEES